jgi:outer membrane protein assembly factor BamA
MFQSLKIKVLFFYFLLCSLLSPGQIRNTSDSLKLPFAIAKEKRLPDEDLKNKKEGTYLTGVPDLSSDPETGFGFGAEAQLFFNGKRTDPFFAYTDYRAEIDLSAFYTTKSEKEFELAWDIPYILNTEWRLRGRCEYSVNPDLLFFGTTEKTLMPYNNLVGNTANYNTFQQVEKYANMSIEHSWFKGKFRTLAGYELVGYNTSTPLNNNSLLRQQAMEGLVTGFGTGRTSHAQVGLIYDTRDLEPDPSNGSFAELTNEISSTALGSEFDYNRIFLSL